MYPTYTTLYNSWLLENVNQKNGFFREVSITFIVAISLWYLWIYSKSSKNLIAPLPPGPRGLPIVGYLPFLGTDSLLLVFIKLAAIYGPIYKFWLGNKLFVVISSPSIAKQVLRDHDATFSDREPNIASQIAAFGGNDIAFDSYSSPTWKKKRKVLAAEMLSNANIKACYCLRREQVIKAIGDLYKNVGKPIDISELSFLTVINAGISMVLGGKLRGEKAATIIEGHFKDVTAELMVLLGKPNISDLFPMIAPLDMQGVAKGMKRISRLFNQLLDSVIELRMKMATEEENVNVDGKSEEKLDFLQFLLELVDKEDSESSITMNQLKGLLMDVLVGGTDTTAAMVEWTMTELIQHPEAMEKVKNELADVVGLQNTVEDVHLPSLRYLHLVIKETLRLHPALPLLIHRCPRQSTPIGGYTVPKGSRVLINAWSIQRDPNVWENPLEFRPERFLHDDPANKFDYHGNDFRYLVFGSGRRKCPGISLGEKMLCFILASFLHSFEWEFPPGTELDLSCKSGWVMKKKKPLVLIPTPRLLNHELYKK